MKKTMQFSYRENLHGFFPTYSGALLKHPLFYAVLRGVFRSGSFVPGFQRLFKSPANGASAFEIQVAFINGAVFQSQKIVQSTLKMNILYTAAKGA
jgi:hypothetical protein